MNTKSYYVKPGSKPDLKKIKTSSSGNFKTKSGGKDLLKENIKKMSELQNKLYAHNKYSMLLIFQAMDAAGKDGVIKHVMSGLNPQGTQVFSFKQPSSEELDHDYLWRINKALPERGRIGIFNRSHYEEVLIVRVHDLIKSQKIPAKFINSKIWETRFQQINNFEKRIYENGTVILKFFLHISKDEQKERFLSRIDNPSKNWKFSLSDIKERKLWNDYQKYYGEAISATSKKHAPWYIIPSDKKWFSRALVSGIIVSEMEKLNLSYPKISDDQLAELKSAKEFLMKKED